MTLRKDVCKSCRNKAYGKQDLWDKRSKKATKGNNRKSGLWNDLYEAEWSKRHTVVCPPKAFDAYVSSIIRDIESSLINKQIDFLNYLSYEVEPEDKNFIKETLSKFRVRSYSTRLAPPVWCPHKEKHY